MIVTFTDAEPDYEVWLERHPVGFVLTLPRSAGGRPMLHRSDCSHIETGAGWAMTRRTKVCSDHRPDIEAWAQANGHGAPLRCSDCRVDD